MHYVSVQRVVCGEPPGGSAVSQTGLERDAVGRAVARTAAADEPGPHVAVEERHRRLVLGAANDVLQRPPLPFSRLDAGHRAVPGGGETETLGAGGLELGADGAGEVIDDGPHVTRS